MNLYQYPQAQVQSGLKDLLDSFQGSGLSWIEQAQVAAQLKFRDRAGRYWCADLYQDEWYFYQDGKWLLSSEVPAFLEGPAILFPGDAELPPLPGEGEVGAGGSPPAKALEDSIRKIRIDYQDGKLSSEAAVLISRRHYLIDLQGGVWTVGLQTGKWYGVKDGAWRAAGGPPPEDQLLKLEGEENPPQLPDLEEEAYGRLLDFLLGDQPLPEGVTAPWDPPAGYPEAVKGQFAARGED